MIRLTFDVKPDSENIVVVETEPKESNYLKIRKGKSCGTRMILFPHSFHPTIALAQAGCIS